MRKFTLPFLLALVLAAMMAAPALAQPQAAAMAMPAGTASPRDWDKIAPNGELQQSAIKADSAILMDASTGKILFEKDADAKRYPASITKIMTCLVALDSKKPLSSIVTVGTLPHLPSDASNIDLKKDEQMTLENLLYGLMLESGNDAANAIAVYIGGSIDKFVDMMNEKAQELGMTGTHYANTNGLHDTDHYTTAHDMALLAKAAQVYPDFVRIVSTYKYTMEPTNKHPKSRIWSNTNKLVNPDKDSPFGYVYATGIKTGYTDPAEYTLVSSAHKDNMTLVAVVLHSAKGDDRWPDSVTMFEYGFNNFDTINLVELLQSQQVSTDINNAAASDEGKGKLTLTLKPNNLVYVTDRKDVIDSLKNDPSQIQPALNITKNTAPIKKDDIVGTATYTYNGETLEFDLLASRDVAEMPASTPSPSASLSASAVATPNAAATMEIANTSGAKTASSSGGLGRALIWAGAVLLVLLAAMLVIRIVNTTRRNKKYRQYNYRQNGTRLRR